MISSYLHSVALSHGVVYRAQHVISWHELYMEVKVLHLNLVAFDAASLVPGENDRQLTIFQMADKRNLNIGGLGRKGDELSARVLENFVG